MRQKKNFSRSYTYTAIFNKTEKGYSVLFPAFEKATCGDDLKDAVFMASDLLKGLLEIYQEDSLQFPIDKQKSKDNWFEEANSFKEKVTVFL
jgi:predicted RNase H-like HicB family nuclease